jgi:hypothetical protein
VCLLVQAKAMKMVCWAHLLVQYRLIVRCPLNDLNGYEMGSRRLEKEEEIE